MRTNTARSLLRRLQHDPGTPATVLRSEAAYEKWVATLSDEDLERERISLLTDDELMAGLANLRQEMLEAPQ
jgi:hypothetical protein